MTAEGLRARKKLDTRRRIESAALGLFEGDGFEQTTVGDIAAAADIAPRTFFHYFATKEDVILSDYADRLRRIVSVLTERPSQEHAWQALQQAFLVVAADYESEQAQLWRRFRIMATTPSVFARSLQLQAGWEDTLAEALAGRLGVDRGADITPRLMASTALAAMRASLAHWLAGGGASSLPTQVAQCFERLSRGLDDDGPGMA